MADREPLTEPTPCILDAQGVADLLGLSKSRVLELLKRGAIPCRQLAGVRKVYVLREELIEALEPRVVPEVFR